MDRLIRLVNAFKQTLPRLPGFRSFSLFGSLAEGRADEYSDIDAGVTTDDLPGAKARLLSLLEEMGPVDFCWLINLGPAEWNPTVAFREESYYHRLDLKITDTSAAGLSTPADETVLSTGESGAYIPEHGSIGHFLLGQYIGCLRYMKARKRGQTMTCYRFASAAVDWQLSLLYARVTSDPGSRSKLSTADYQHLDRLLSDRDRTALLPSLDFSSPTAMDNVVRIGMGRMLEEALLLAEMSGETIPTKVFERISAFVSEELKGAWSSRMGDKHANSAGPGW